MPVKIGVKGYRFLAIAITVLSLVWPAWQAGSEVRVVPQTVRVGLAQNTQQVSFTLQGNYKIINANTGNIIAEDSEGHHWAVENVGGLLQVLQDGQRYGVYNGPIKAEEINTNRSILTGNGTLIKKDSLSGLALQNAGDDVISLSNQQNLHVIGGDGQIQPLPRGETNLICLEKNKQLKRYRGNLEIRLNEQGLTVINELPIEQYLYGVVPAEMPASFPLEALKAQAVVSRSYLIAQLGSYGTHGFDILDSQNSQVYAGYDTENAVTTMAVDDTKGLVLVYRGQPISAFFHSSSGGFTENSEDVYSDVLAYIRGKEDKFDNNAKYYNWSVSYSANELTSLINEQLTKTLRSGAYKEFSLITDIIDLERTSSGQRIKKILITGKDTEGKPQDITVQNANRVRMVLGLRSAMFNINKELQQNGAILSVTFNGNGWGHGLGMSQWGASGLASEGYSFQDILQYYYTGIKLEMNYGT